MKATIHIGWLLFFGVLLIAIGYHLNEYLYVPSKTFTVRKDRNFDIITLKLPNDVDPQVFGSKYWEAFHKLAEMIPCAGCRSNAVPFMRFFHDIVNKETGKKLYDKANYDRWIKELCQANSKKA